MGASGSKDPTKEVNKSEERIDKDYNKYLKAPESFMCKNDNAINDNIQNTNNFIYFFIYFFILFFILFSYLLFSYLLYNYVIK
jgi:hypothetical protein